MGEIPSIATEAIIASLIVTVIALTLVASLYVLPQPPKSYEAPYEILGRGVPGGWELVLINPAPHMVRISVNDTEVGVEGLSIKVVRNESPIPPVVKIKGSDYEVWIDLSTGLYVYVRGISWWFGNAFTGNASSLNNQPVAVLQAGLPGKYAVLTSEGWRIYHYTKCSPKIVAPKSKTWVVETSNASYVIFWRGSKEEVNAIEVAPITSTKSKLIIHSVEDVEIQLSDFLAWSGELINKTLIKKRVSIAPCEGWDSITFELRNSLGQLVYRTNLMCSRSGDYLSISQSFTYGQPCSFCRDVNKVGITLIPSCSLPCRSYLEDWGTSAWWYAYRPKRVERVKVWAIVQEGSSKSFYCVGEAVGGGSEVWLLPKSVVKAVTYHVPVVLNPPEALRPPTVKAVPPNTYLAASSIGAYDPLKAVLLPIPATITLFTEAVIIRGYGDLSIHWTSGTINITHTNSKVMVTYIGSRYVVPESSPKVEILWNDEGMTIATDLGATTIPIGLPKPETIYIEGNATVIALTP